MAGLTWCGTNGPEVQICFPVMDLTVHLSGAQHPTVIVGVHLNGFSQKGYETSCHTRKGYQQGHTQYCRLRSSAMLQGSQPCYPDLAEPGAGSSCTGLPPRSRVDKISQHLFPFNLLFLYVLV